MVGWLVGPKTQCKSVSQSVSLGGDGTSTLGSKMVGLGLGLGLGLGFVFFSLKQFPLGSDTTLTNSHA